MLSQRYRLRYDRLYGRLYTIISIPERRQEVLRNYKVPQTLQNPKETDVNAYLDAEVRAYISSLEEYLYNIGLFELVSIAQIDSVDEVNVLLVLRYKYNNHRKFLYGVLITLGVIVGVAVLAGIFKFLLILINFIIHL